MPRKQTNLRGPKDHAHQKKAPKRKAGRSLDAFSIAEEEVPHRLGVRRNRLGGQDDFIKRGHEGDSADGPGTKRRKTEDGSDDDNGGSDGEGHEWKIGEVDSDDDSELDSDEAMGSSDEERFEGFAFRGSSTSKAKPKKNTPSRSKPEREVNLSENDDQSDDSDREDMDEGDDDFGEDGIDLTTAWDMNMAEEEEAKKAASKREKPASENDFGDSASEDEESEASDNESELSVSDDEAGGASGLLKLQNFVNSMDTETTSQRGRKTGASQEQGRPTEYGLTSSRKLTVADLLPSISDSRLKNSLKNIDSAPSQKTKSSGVPGKLDAPLAKRQQDRLDRGAAYDKSKETLDRWLETVKANRRAEHLTFPLPDPDAQQMQKMGVAKPQTDLESTIQNILVESGLAEANGKSNEDQLQEMEELQVRKLPVEEIQARRAELRKRRDLLFREEVRAKRIKKIKSKSYRRKHRKDREKTEQQERQALIDAGVDLEEEEREQNERRRAEARMGSKHKDSKWAKSLRQTGRTAWDQDARNNAADLAQKEDELRKRIEGKRVSRGDDDYLGSSESESEDDDPWREDGSDVDDRKTRQELSALEAGDDDRSAAKGPYSNLLSMKFMQNAEASRKAQNDAEVRRMNRELHGEQESESEAESEVGRRKFGHSAADKVTETKTKPQPKNEFEEALGSDDEEQIQDDDDVEIVVDRPQKQTSTPSVSKNSARSRSGPSRQEEPAAPGNPWLVQTSRNNRRPATNVQERVDITVGDSEPKSTNSKRKSKPQHAKKSPQNEPADNTNDSDDEANVPVLLKNHDLVKRAFAGDEVVQDFEQEKLDTIEDENDKVVDNTLPGWGSWTGDGVSKKQKKKQKRFLTTVEGVKPENRQDAKLNRVIINEKRVKKVRHYLRTGLHLLWNRQTNLSSEQQVHGNSAPSSLRDPTAVRAFYAPSYRPRVVHEGYIPGLDQASCDDQAGRHQAHGEANDLRNRRWVEFSAQLTGMMMHGRCTFGFDLQSSYILETLQLFSVKICIALLA